MRLSKAHLTIGSIVDVVEYAVDVASVVANMLVEEGAEERPLQRDQPSNPSALYERIGGSGPLSKRLHF